MAINFAGVAELVYARDSKSRVLTDVWVRVPPPAPAFAKASAGLRQNGQ